MKFFSTFILCLSFATTYAQSPIVTKDAAPYTREYKPVTGILGAFDEEIKYLLTLVSNKTEKIIQQVKFTEGDINGHKVVVAQTGIGKVNAAITTTLMIEHFMPREIIFTGIAGGTNPVLSPGDIVIGQQVAYHDYGTQTADSLMRRPTRNPFTMRENPVFYPGDVRLVNIALKASAQAKFQKLKTSSGERHPNIISGVIVTGDVFVASTPAVTELRTELKADATEMEGAAVAQTCSQQSQPLVVVRSLSDNAGTAASSEVAQFYQLAARNSATLVVAMVSLL